MFLFLNEEGAVSFLKVVQFRIRKMACEYRRTDALECWLAVAVKALFFLCYLLERGSGKCPKRINTEDNC